MQFVSVFLMQYVVDAGVDQLLLFILQVLSHIIWHKHNAAFTTHHKQEPIQSLTERERFGIIITQHFKS